MNDFYLVDTEKTEKLAHDILSRLHFKVEQNNKKTVTDVDLKINDKIKIDVQFIRNFNGTIYFDFISAFYYNEQPIKYKNDILNRFQKEKNASIKKPGKYFQDDYVDYVIILAYNDKNLNNNDLEEIFFISKDDVLDYFNNISLNEIKINNKKKHELKDDWESSFVPFEVSDFEKKMPNSLRFNRKTKLKDMKLKIERVLNEIV
jgi:hypothetical protein